jgi:hypothetical protein
MVVRRYGVCRVERSGTARSNHVHTWCDDFPASRGSRYIHKDSAAGVAFDVFSGQSMETRA